MSYQADVFEVLICSPSDVEAERALVRNTLHEWNDVNSTTRNQVLLPLAWETHTYPDMGRPPQEVIDEQIVQRGDLLIGVFWTRIGTPTEEYASGSVEEIEKYIDAGKPVMLFFSSMPVVSGSVDQEQFDELQAFRESCEKRGLLETYDSLDAFRRKLGAKLQLMTNRCDLFGSREATEAPTLPGLDDPQLPNLTREAQVLLVEAANDKNGVIIHVESFSGMQVSTNNRQFVDQADARSRATWGGAIDELEAYELAERTSDSISRITRKGYERADLLSR